MHQNQLAESEIHSFFGLKKGRSCPENTRCTFVKDPSDKFMNFDNIGTSLLTIFIIASLEGWSGLMYKLNATMFPQVLWIYFILAIMLVTFLILNLFVAVLVASFSRIRERQHRSAFSKSVEVPVYNELILQDLFGEWYLYRRGDRRHVIKSLWVTHLPDKFTKFCRELIQKTEWEVFIVLSILLNIFILASDSTTASPSWRTFLYASEIYFSVFFAIEVFIRVVGYGAMRTYMRFTLNRFDFLIGVMTLIALLPYRALRFLRFFRLLRLGRAMLKYQPLRELLEKVFASLAGIFNLLFFILFTMAVSSLIGMQLLGGAFEDEPLPRGNFENMWQSFLSLFQVVTGENWTDLLFESMRVSHGLSQAVVVAFFLTFYAFTNFILLNLFIAVILENFELDDEEKNRIQEAKYHRSVSRVVKKIESKSTKRAIPPPAIPPLQALVSQILSWLRTRQVAPLRGYAPKMDVDFVDNFVERVEEDYGLNTTLLIISRFSSRFLRVLALWTRAGQLTGGLTKLFRRTGKAAAVSMASASRDTMLKEDEEVVAQRQATEIRRRVMMKDRGRNILHFKEILFDSNPDDLEASTNNSSSGFSDDSSDTESTTTSAQSSLSIRSLKLSDIRSFIRKILNSDIFQALVLVAILSSCIILAIQNPSKRDSKEWRSFFETADTTFLSFFSAEIFLKMMVNGVFFGHSAFFKNGWNRLDFFVLFFMYLSYFSSSQSVLSSLRVLRAGRALPPLRVIARNPGMKVIINSLLRSLPAILNVGLLLLGFFVVSSVIAADQFMGLLQFCNDSAVNSKSECVGVFINSVGILAPRRWGNPSWNFDSTLEAFITLFQVSTLEGWVDVLRSTMDITDLNKQPRQNSSPQNALFFIIFVFIASFFLVKLFVGVIIDHFNQQRGTALLTSEQRNWIDTRKFLTQLRPSKRPPRPSNRFRAFLYDISRHSLFEKFIFLAISLNVLLMTTDHYNSSKEYNDFTAFANRIFLAIYVTEATVRILALSLVGYFRSGWNIFDFVVTFGSLISEFSSSQISGNFVRAFRIGRMARVVRGARGLRTLLNTLIVSVPSVLNIASLLFLFLFIYAIFGMDQFGVVRYGSQVNQYANFQNFGTSMLLLFRMATGEAWQQIMHDCTVEEPACYVSEFPELTDCGNKWMARFFFFSFETLGVYIFLNLYIAVILENFSYCYNKEQSVISAAELRKYINAWSKFDSQATGSISTFKLRPFVEYIGEPLGMSESTSKEWFREVYHEILMMTKGEKDQGIAWSMKSQLRFLRQGVVSNTDPGQVSFSDVLAVLSRKKVGLSSLPYKERKEREMFLEEMMRDLAATRINAAIKGYINRRKFRKLVEEARLEGSTNQDAVVFNPQVNLPHAEKKAAPAERRKMRGRPNRISLVQTLSVFLPPAH
eukprot:TRINITY_DN7990_c0_g1_i1.p1 TRINITY_DN7990_c0_g1~~TRINITY_DN7990_c0_g1_i1.p1  ORF type:complete len:1641 (-),score=380.66 TRINITY_DN7990_c0_g1_i1:246-4454(-)